MIHFATPFRINIPLKNKKPFIHTYKPKNIHTVGLLRDQQEYTPFHMVVSLAKTSTWSIKYPPISPCFLLLKKKNQQLFPSFTDSQRQNLKLVQMSCHGQYSDSEDLRSGLFWKVQQSILLWSSQFIICHCNAMYYFSV